MPLFIMLTRVPIRHCHADAWEGLKKLYADVHASGAELPPVE